MPSLFVFVGYEVELEYWEDKKCVCIVANIIIARPIQRKPRGKGAPFFRLDLDFRL